MTTIHDELAELRATQVRPPRTITVRERIAQLEAAERRTRGLALARERIPGYDAKLEAARAAEATAKVEYDRELALRHQRSLKGIEEAKRKLVKAGPFARFRPAADVDDNFDNAQIMEATPFGSIELVKGTLEETIAENRWRLAMAKRLRLERLPLALWQVEDADASVAHGEELRVARLARRGTSPADVDLDNDQKAQRRRRGTSAA